MPFGRRTWVAAFLVIGVLWNASVAAQDRDALAKRWRDLALTKDSEVGFERLIHMAQVGQLGKDVSNANVGVFKNYARLELVRGGAPTKVFLLTPRTSTTRACRYFNIEPGDGASASDVAGV